MLQHCGPAVYWPDPACNRKSTDRRAEQEKEESDEIIFKIMWKNSERAQIRCETQRGISLRQLTLLHKSTLSSLWTGVCACEMDTQPPLRQSLIICYLLWLRGCNACLRACDGDIPAAET